MKQFVSIFMMCLVFLSFMSCEKVKLEELEPEYVLWHKTESNGDITVRAIDDKGNAYYYQGESPVKKLKIVEKGSVPSTAVSDIAGIMWDLHLSTGTGIGQADEYFHVDQGGLVNGPGNYSIPFIEDFRADEFNQMKDIFRKYCVE